MDYRSSNPTGFVHFGGDIVAGAQDGNGVSIESFSTGTNPRVRAMGNDTAASLRLEGASSVSGSGVIIGTGSTTALNAIERYLIQYTPPALAASTFTSSTFTASGLTTAAVLLFTPQGNVSGAYVFRPQCSTAGELRLFFQNITGSTIGTGESTQRGMLMSWRF